MTPNKHIEIIKLDLRIKELLLLEDFHLVLEQGKRIGITGPSGCGKSTLLKSILENKTPQGTTFEIFSVNNISDSFKIGYLPQTSGLLPWFSLRKNLSIFSNNSQLREEVLNIMELSNNLDSFPHQLSGGEQQRALLACNITLSPQLFLADEPLTEIDILRKWKLLFYWSSKIKAFNSSLLIVSHDIDTLLFMCDEIIMLSDKPSRIIKKVEINSVSHPRCKDDLLSQSFIEHRGLLSKSDIE